MSETRAYLGVPLTKPRVAFFDFTGCQGCQLQVINNEATLLDFLALVDVVNFREARTNKSNDYEIAFIEGSITRDDEVERLKTIRDKAAIVVALGSCACFGGVNQLKNRFKDLAWVKKQVYNSHPIDTLETRATHEVVKVDLKIPGCPIKKEELERIVLGVALGRTVELPDYPVCMECKASENICLFDLGEPCLGPVTRAGCGAWCTSRRAVCWGCRGPAEEPNMNLMREVMQANGFTQEDLLDRLECFGGFSAHIEQIREGKKRP